MASETSIIREGQVVLYPGTAQETKFNPASVEAPKVRDALVAVAIQRIFREATAGKVDVEDDRIKAKVRCTARFSAWINGELEVARGEAVKLTDVETANAVWSFILGRKRMAGDKRSETELRSAWNKVDEAKRTVILEKNKKAIAKTIRQALQAKKRPQDTDF